MAEIEPASATEAKQAPQGAELQGSTTRTLGLNELTDMKGKPMRLNSRFLLHENGSNPSRLRMLDWEDNKRQVVFNPKNHDGLYLKLDKRFHPNAPNAFSIHYPGGDDWLMGVHMDSDDVVLGKTGLASEWYFTNESTDEWGHKCYEIWSKRKTMGGGGNFPIHLPTDSLARAGYDKDWEWRTYSYGEGAHNGFFKVKFERIDPDSSFGDLIGDLIGDLVGAGGKPGGGEGPTTKPGIIPPGGFA